MDAGERGDGLARGGDGFDLVDFGREDAQGQRAAVAAMQPENGEGIAMGAAHDGLDLALLGAKHALRGAKTCRHSTVSSARAKLGSMSSSAAFKGTESQTGRFSPS